MEYQCPIANHDNPVVVMFFNIFGKRELQVTINMFCAESDKPDSYIWRYFESIENSLNTTYIVALRALCLVV